MAPPKAREPAQEALDYAPVETEIGDDSGQRERSQDRRTGVHADEDPQHLLRPAALRQVVVDQRHGDRINPLPGQAPRGMMAAYVEFLR
jgi:hypothetical protein